MLPNNLTSASLREVALNKLVALNSNTATANTVRGWIYVHTHIHAYCRSGNFRALNFRVKKFSWSRIPTKIFYGIKSILRSQVWWSGTRLHMPRKWTVCCVRGCHIAVGKVFVWEREPKNTVRMYCGSKDRQFIGHWAKRCNTFSMSQLWVSRRSHPVWNN